MKIKFSKIMVSFLIIFSMLITLIPSISTEVSAGLDPQRIVDFLYSKWGNPERRSYCLGFVNESFMEVYGTPFSSACCASRYGDMFIDSTGWDIPIGADVFFGGSSVTCNGQDAGHVAIYVGDGYIFHDWDATCERTTIQYVLDCGYYYRGWGWHGDFDFSTEKRQLDGVDPIDIGSDFYAHIRHPASGLYLTDRDYNVSAQPGVFDPSQTWHFVRQSNGSYSIGIDGSGCYMDVAGADYSDGTNIHMYQGNGSNAQNFFIYFIHGNYYFKTVPEDKCLDVDFASNNLQLWGNTSGVFSSEFEKNARSFEILKLQIDGSLWNANLGQQYECFIRNWHTGHLLTAEGDNAIFRDPAFADNQKWIVTRNEYGGHEIKSVATGKALDVAGSAIEHGLDINLYAPNGSKAQNFFFIDTGEARFYIKPSYSHLVMDMDANNMEIHTCHYGTGGSQLVAQVFELITVNHVKDNLEIQAPEYLGERFTAKISSPLFNTYLTDNNGVSMAGANNSNNQIWTFTYDAKWQAYKIIGSSGKALDVQAGGWASGTPLQMFDSNDSAAQRFRFYTTGNGYYISPANTQKILDIDFVGGSLVQIYGNTPQDHRLFGITLVTFNGKSPVNLGETFTTHIKNKASGLYLTGASGGVLSCTGK